MIDLVYFRMHFYCNLSQNVCPKYRCFCKIIYICNNTLKVSKYCEFFLNKNDIGSNFVECIKEWFSAEDIRIMEKMVQLSTLHIWINSHIFQNITIFMK